MNLGWEKLHKRKMWRLYTTDGQWTLGEVRYTRGLFSACCYDMARQSDNARWVVDSGHFPTLTKAKEALELMAARAGLEAMP